MFTRKFLKDAAERAVATAVQALFAVMLVGGGFNAFDFDWSNALAVTVSAALLSLVKSGAAYKLQDHTVSLASLVSDDEG